MNPLEYEKRLKVHRATQAATRGLMGVDGKIGTVLRFLGQPIVAQSEGETSLFEGDMGISHRSRQMDDLWLLDDGPEQARNPVDLTNSIPTSQGEHEDPEGSEWTTRKRRRIYSQEVIGLNFDGLSRGMHLEIRFMEQEHSLTVRWKGYLVYEEVGGDLRAYIPMQEWEDKIEVLYKLAKPKELDHRKAEEQVKESKAKRENRGWLRSIIARWGASE